MDIHSLSRPYRSVDGAPVLVSVDLAIFRYTYFTRCMSCSFCGDRCCSYGVDVDAENHKRIIERAEEIEHFVGVPRTEWFTDIWTQDAEFAGGSHTRTRVVDGRCVFLNRRGRGCQLHAFALSERIDYHVVKPMVSTLYPLTFEEGLLHPSREVVERDLICLDQGPTLYRGVRDELAHYFGSELVAELDRFEAAYKKTQE